ncbi:hypothetical protein D3C73_1059430 [compost metagenome]
MMRSAAVAAQMEAEKTVLRFIRFNEHRSGAVTEQDAGAAVAVIRNLRQGIRSQHKHLAVQAGSYIGMGRMQCIHKACAGSAHIHRSRSRWNAETMLND